MNGDNPVGVKYDLSIGGSIEADFGNLGCTDPFVTDETFGTLSSFSGNVATYSPDSGGWSGQVLLIECKKLSLLRKQILNKYDEPLFIASSSHLIVFSNDERSIR